MLRDVDTWNKFLREVGFYVQYAERTSYYDKDEKELYLQWIHQPKSDPSVNCHVVAKKNNPQSSLFFGKMMQKEQEEVVNEKVKYQIERKTLN